MSSSSRAKHVVRAAGALVWRERRGRLEVLLVHRPRYDDWSFPKGKVEPGESVRTCAVREVAEETGARIALGQPLETIRYAASLRRERGLANAPLAFVTGVGWCPPGVLTFLVRDVLVLVNTTQEAVVLPAGAKVLLSSHMLDRSDGILRVPPTTTVWLRSSTVR